MDKTILQDESKLIKDGDDDDLQIDVRDQNTEYAPPSMERNNEINRSTVDRESKLIKSRELTTVHESVRASIVSISEVPALNVYDLTRRSENMRKIRDGEVTQPQDLACEILPDEKIKASDLVVIEKEVNKKK